MSKLISVIIPTYNRADIITDAINSVLEQTYQIFEIIVVDDGSTDNTVEIIKKIDDSRIIYIYQENSGRPSAARNTGIKKSTGDYIAFLDSDDLWHREKLEKQIAILDNNPNIGLVTNWSSYKTFNNEEIKIKMSQAKSQRENILYILTAPDKAFTGTPTLLVRKECLEKVGSFDETMTFCEDWDLFFRISLLYEIYNIEKVLTYIRIHQENISKTPNANAFMESYLIYLQKAFENENLSTELLKIKGEAYSNAWWSIGGWALHKSKDYQTARKSFLESIKYSHNKIFNVRFLVEFILVCGPELFCGVYGYSRSIYRKLLGKKC